MHLNESSHQGKREHTPKTPKPAPWLRTPEPPRRSMDHSWPTENTTKKTQRAAQRERQGRKTTSQPHRRESPQTQQEKTRTDKPTKNPVHHPSSTNSPWRNNPTENPDNVRPQASSLALSLESEWNWSLIDQQGRTATKNRPSQRRPPGDPMRKSHPQVGGLSPISVVEMDMLCIQSQRRSQWSTHRGQTSNMWRLMSSTLHSSQRGEGR